MPPLTKKKDLPRGQPPLPLPYGMRLTKLFSHVTWESMRTHVPTLAARNFKNVKRHRSIVIVQGKCCRVCRVGKVHELLW